MLTSSFPIFFVIFPLVLGDLTKIIDLTWNFDDETIYWGDIAPFKYTKIVEGHDWGYWYSMKEFCAGEHGGTHFDAPYHFNQQGWKVGEVPIERLFANGALLEVPENDNLRPGHLDSWVKKNGQFDNNTVLLVKFGRSQFWPNRTHYMGIEGGGKLTFPGLSEEAANWIAGCGKIVGVGVDTPSVDPGISIDLKAHRILSDKQIYNMENVKILEELPAKGFKVVVFPMKLKDGTGAPLRVMAVPKNFL